MSRSWLMVGAVLVAAGLSGCGGSDSTSAVTAASTAHGTLAVDPPLRVASVDAATLQAQLSSAAGGKQLLQVTGAPACGVDFYYIRYWTTGGAGEVTESSGALMVPTGAGNCSGSRPIVLYAHGTQTEKAFNIANIQDPGNSEGALVAAMFAAQGFIVVAPNYAGYDISTLGYHPFLNASQQSGEMIDSLSAARSALPNTFGHAISDSGKLFLTGYSEGGYVALATLRAMEGAGMPVTAAAPMSGPYALEALFDAVMFGDVDLDSTVFSPLVTTSYQHAYGNLYSSTSDFYSSTYASGIDTLLPTTQPETALFTNNLLPLTALFDSTTPTAADTGSALLAGALAEPANPSDPRTALFDLGFGNPYLINNSVRIAYAADVLADPDGVASGGAALAAAVPTYPLRKDLYQNDLRAGSWAPTVPTLLCGGSNDPVVFFSVDTEVMAAFWSGLSPNPVTVLDVDPAGGPSGPFAAIQTGFQTSQAAELALLQTPDGGGLSLANATQALVQNYHGTSVPPFCSLAARGFFQSL
jgi:hypothetical protein